jgi:mono/diheme cytochrome c family protein
MRVRPLSIAAGLVGVVAMAALVGCGGGEAEAGGSDSLGVASKGAPIFRRVCATCHGMKGKGMPNLGKDMTASTFINGSSDEELLKFVKVGRLPSDPLSDGKSAMPPKGGDPTLTDEQLLDVIAFIRTIQQ